MEPLPPRQWYSELAPPPSLAGLVASFWDICIPAVEETRVRILPNACVDIVVYVSDTSFGEGSAGIVAPPHRSYIVGSTLRSFMVRSAGWRHVVGVSLLPAGVQRMLGMPARLLGEGILLLDEVIGSRATYLEDRVLTGAPQGALQRLREVLLELRSSDNANALVERAVTSLRNASGLKRMDALASEANVSTRKLERHFLEHVGISAKTYARLIRFDRAVRDLDGRGARGWSQFALDHGYSDQAHFINEFKEFAGITPTQFEAESKEMPWTLPAAPHPPEEHA